MMKELFQALLDIMIALGLFPGADCNLLIAMIFAWTICADSCETENGANERNRIIQWVSNVTNQKKEDVICLQQKYGDNKLFKSSALDECFSFIFPYVSNVPDNLRLIDRWFLLYYTIKYSCAWNELPDKIHSWMNKQGVSEDTYQSLQTHTNRIEVNPCFHQKRTTGYLQKCLEILDMFHKDHSVLLEQLRAVKCYKWNRTNNKPLDLSIASDIPAGRQKENNNMLRGPRPENRIYEETLKHLLTVPVSDIINRLYYFGECDDAIYETEFLLKELQKDATDNVLVVNPSPDLIRKINQEY